jgi:glucosylceramidase
MTQLTSRRSLLTLGGSFFLLCSLVVFSFLPPLQVHAANEPVSVWLTTPDQANLLTQQGNVTFSGTIRSNPTTITVNEGLTYQQMVGFGASLTDASAWLIYNKLSASQRTTLLNNLFSASSGVGLDFLRQPMGASDLTLPASGEYSYDDMPAGQTDPSLAHFSISHDTSYIIPVLQQALQINPNIKIMGTPWSPPGWMKSTGSMEGGTLNSNAYVAYANYFVKFIQAYQALGLPIYAISPQNEPLYVPTGYPGMSMPATTERDFIKNYLGPAFSSNGITTNILGYDHNWDQPGYPETILSDSTASSYTSGVAWHCYAGTVDAQTTVHNLYPSKDTYETECSGGTWEGSNWPNGFQNTMELLINTTRNWSKTVVRWGLALDTNNGPNLGTGASCTTCRGIVTINQSNGAVTYNSDYYALGQASKFVVPGASRIDSNSFGSKSIEDVAFKNPDGSRVLVVYNSRPTSKTFQVQWNNEAFSYTLPAGAVATFKW